MGESSALLPLVLLLVIAAEFVNGWTDAPNAIATPLPLCSASVACSTHSPQRLRCLAPARARRQLIALNTAPPRKKPDVAAHLVNLAWNGLSGLEHKPKPMTR